MAVTYAATIFGKAYDPLKISEWDKKKRVRAPLITKQLGHAACTDKQVEWNDMAVVSNSVVSISYFGILREQITMYPPRASHNRNLKQWNLKWPPFRHQYLTLCFYQGDSFKNSENSF